MNLLTLDIETYYDNDYSLSKMTTEAYLRDPRFELIMVSLKFGAEPAFWVDPERFIEIAAEIDWAETTVICHHAHFDCGFLGFILGITPGFIIDTMSMARIVDGPKAGISLAKCCERHGLPAKGTYVVNAKGKHRADFTPQQMQDYGAYCCNDSDRTYELAQIYLPQIPETALRLIDLKTRFFTEPAFIGNVPLLAQAVIDERARKQALLERLGATTREHFTSNPKFAELLRTCGVEPEMKVSPTTGEQTYAFAKTDPAMQALLEHEDETIRFLAEARVGVKSTIIESRAQRFHDCARRGPLPVYIKPYGVHTGRGSAGDGMNWMNLTSVNSIRPEMTVIKRAIAAPPGYKVVAADSAQIQARGTSWLAGQHDKVEAFAQKRDVYSEFASLIYNRKVDRKKNPDDFIPGQVGKISELSNMFGLGWYSAALNFLKGCLGAPPIQFTEADMTTLQVDPSRFMRNPRTVTMVEQMPSRLGLSDRLIHCAVTDAIVRRWREKNPAIVQLWATMEKAINAMIAGEYMPIGGAFCTEKDAIVAPSGMRLRYRGLQRDEQGEATYFDGRTRQHIYGGSATNNIIQLLEQEIIGPQMLAISDAGFPVKMECYDSIVCVVPAADAERCLAFMLATMENFTEPWAKGLPLAAEGGIGQTYAEAK